MDTQNYNLNPLTETELPSVYAASYERVLPRLLAIPKAEIKPIRIDIGSALATALAAVPKIRALRERIAHALPDADMEMIDGLEDFALALFHLDALCQKPTETPAIIELSLRAKHEKTRLLRDAKYLVEHGLIAQAQIDELSGGASRVELGKDLLTLVSIFRDSWPAVKGRTPVTEQALADAFVLGDAVYRAAGAPKVTRAMTNEEALNRARGVMLFTRSYAESRYAVQYVLRKEGGADDVTPTLYKTKPKKRAALTTPTKESASPEMFDA